MLTKKSVHSLAKKLASISFDKESVDMSRVRAIIEEISTYNEKFRPLLYRQYLYFLEQNIKKHTLRIEYAGEVNIDKLHQLVEGKYNCHVHVVSSENKQLLAGVCMYLHDFIIERSLRNDIHLLREINR